MLARKVLMISPDNFGFNHDTAVDNFFQKKFSLTEEEIKSEAQKEFMAFKNLLEAVGIEVMSFSPEYSVPCPDAVFPNNWFSTHPSGQAVLYPMKSASRRNERHPVIIEYLKSCYKKITDLSDNENHDKFLEGTGSIVMDDKNKTAYASLSQRTNELLFYEWCNAMKYRPIFFHAQDEDGNSIYHTNVLLSMGDGFTLVCLAAISDLKERKLMADSLAESGNARIEISISQMHQFAANALALENKKGKQVLVISSRGWSALDDNQQNVIRSFCSQIITPNLNIIETCGGGSARCMLAELF